MFDESYHVEVNSVNCKECGYCLEICAPKVFAKSDSVNTNGYRYMKVVNEEECDGCQKCVMICPDFAIKVQEVTNN
ncbi:MAG: 4Fe-4S dicluster domain-containing protein [Syntrophomonadaceae bacterium]|jgi:NAD-dependent dihydropyrimidine dehydrogenase PreA subunit|nr:4Fe-4S dicluster domain-containing protein [Syntrophomonadaceae bacterium]